MAHSEEYEHGLAPTPLDPWGSLRGGMLDSYNKCDETNGAPLIEAGINGTTHMVALAENLRRQHGLGEPTAVPDRNRMEPASKINQKKAELGWPGFENEAGLGKDTGWRGKF